MINKTQKIIDEWIAHAMCTDPISKPRVEEVIGRIYAQFGLRPPRIEFFPSPWPLIMRYIEYDLEHYGASMLYLNHFQVLSRELSISQIKPATDVWNKVHIHQNKSYLAIRDVLNYTFNYDDIIWGNFATFADAADMAMMCFAREAFGKDIDDDRINLAKESFWVSMFDNVALVSDRPKYINSKGHVLFRDGIGVNYED